MRTSELVVVEFQEQKAQVTGPVGRQGAAQLVAADIQVQQVGNGGNGCNTPHKLGTFGVDNCQLLESCAEDDECGMFSANGVLILLGSYSWGTRQIPTN